MKLSLSSYQNYINDLKGKLIGERLYSPILLNNETILFPFENLKSQYLVVSLNNQNPLCYVIENNEFFSSMETHNFLKFKKQVGKTVIKNLNINEHDFILTLDLVNIDSNNEINLVVELISKKPDLLILKDGFVIDSLLRKHELNSEYILPNKIVELNGNESINYDVFYQHFKNEIDIRKKEKYAAFTKFLTAKIKSIHKKIAQINNDVVIAKDNLAYEEIANEIFTLEYNLKGHYESICLSNGCIKLDESKTLLENIEHFYKKAKKAKETIKRSEANISNAQNELKEFEAIYNQFKNSSEKDADKLVEIYGKKNKKKEVAKTIFNTPYLINLNGTYIYFGKNASQNDYLSFVMKLDRDYTWLHIKDLSGSHIIICNKKPTEKELLFSCELALIMSKVSAAEVIYTKKKNVRRGHTLGEAILKNYSTIKVNKINQETIDIFASAKKVS